MDRRRFVQLGVTAGGAGLVAAALLEREGAVAGAPNPRRSSPALTGSGDHEHDAQSAVLAQSAVTLPPPYTLTMPVPEVLRPVASTWDTDIYEVAARPVTSEIVPGLATAHLGYNGGFIGPTIRAWAGRKTVIRHTNQLDRPLSAHLHGGHVSPENDGQPMNLYGPGEGRTYLYPNRQYASTMWYHDHAHGFEAENTYRGLAGFYLISDLREELLPLPSGRYDVPIMLRDVNMQADGGLFFDLADRTGRTTVLVNGKPQPRFEVAARKYRFRILNASNRRTFQLRLGADEPFLQIASDGGLLPAPVELSQVRVTPGERVELVVDFSRYAPGTTLELTNTADTTGATLQVMRFDVTRPELDLSFVPRRLRELPPLPPATAERTILFNKTPDGHLAIDGKLYDPDRVDSVVRHGTSEIWTIRNVGAPGHNFHMHLVQFRILDRNGAAPPPNEAGLKDVVWLAPDETVRIQATFNTYVGRYPYHCHILDHSSEGMMAQLEVVR
jgi:FtsP/CotA-like multicopper oxidase with cupredoxin domain